MELFPAIDLHAGTAVRLTQGDFTREVTYGDPLALATSFMDQGARWVHVVDLAAARTGVPHERTTLAAIAALADPNSSATERAGGAVKVQTGGGIRRVDDVAEVLALGVARVVLGTAALEDPSFATSCARRWPGQIAVGLDYVVAPDGSYRALGHGWADASGHPLLELLALWRDEPIGGVVATAIQRDGMLEGPDLAGLETLLAATALPIVASGGVSSLADLEALAALSVGSAELSGVIVGKALVEGRFSVKEALAACAPSA